MLSEVEKKVNKELLSTLTSLRAKISEVLTEMDREVVIHPYKMFLSRIEAVMEATGVFIK
jgi:hypothetical protein